MVPTHYRCATGGLGRVVLWSYRLLRAGRNRRVDLDGRVPLPAAVCGLGAERAHGVERETNDVGCGGAGKWKTHCPNDMRASGALVPAAASCSAIVSPFPGGPGGRTCTGTDRRMDPADPRRRDLLAPGLPLLASEAFEAAHDGPDRDAVHAAEPPEHAAMKQLPLDEVLHLAGVAVGEGPALRQGYAAVVRAVSTTAGSTRMPGPIVDDVAIDLM